MPSSKRGIRVGGVSGRLTDRQRSVLSLTQCDVDVIVGDWMSECTMTWHGAAKHEIKQNDISDIDRVGPFDPSFMDTFTPALLHIQEKGIKLAVNAGASDTEMLAKHVEKTVQEKGLSLKVAWI
jgi:4-hydroxy-3-methylbut-2-enyl diphosphate reductase IspH